MLPDEVRALGEVAGEAVTGLAAQVQEVHAGIADRVFKAVSLGVGAAVVPVRVVHDRVTSSLYGAAQNGLSALAHAGARAAGAIQPADAPPIERAAAGRVALGALNGAFGDRLHQRGNPLALRMTLRCGPRDVELDAASLRTAFPNASSRLAVFLHGLCETDDAWKLRAAQHVPYGYRLQAELGYTPLFIRYNTGLHISENGRELSMLLEQLTSAWPVEVGEIALIGHSMGGLVSRSACHYGAEREWTSKVRHVFTLGAPHRGAPLEQVTHAASAAFALLPETRPLARALNARSVGIKDLRHGFLVDEDWLGSDPDAFLRRAASEIPFPRHANHYFVCATLSREAHAPVGRAIGDLLVLRASAWGHDRRGERMQFPVDHYKHVGGATHFDLLNHPAIYDQIRRWLMSRKALPAGVAG